VGAVVPLPPAPGVPPHLVLHDAVVRALQLSASLASGGGDASSALEAVLKAAAGKQSAAAATAGRLLLQCLVAWQHVPFPALWQPGSSCRPL